MKTRKHGKNPKHVTKKMRGDVGAVGINRRNYILLSDNDNNTSNDDNNTSNDDNNTSNDDGNQTAQPSSTPGNDVFKRTLVTGDRKIMFSKNVHHGDINDANEDEDAYIVGKRIIPAIRGAMQPYHPKEWYNNPYSTRIAPGMPQHRYFNEEYTNMIQNLGGLNTNPDTDSFFLHVNRHATSCNNMKLGKIVTGVNKDFEPGLPIDALYKTAYLGICRFRAQVSGGEWDPKFDLNKEMNTPSETGLSLHTSCIAVSCLYLSLIHI